MRKVWRKRIEGIERRVINLKRESVFVRKELGYEEVAGPDGYGTVWKPMRFQGTLRQRVVALVRHLGLKAERRNEVIKFVPKGTKLKFEPVFYCPG